MYNKRKKIFFSTLPNDSHVYGVVHFDKILVK